MVGGICARDKPVPPVKHCPLNWSFWERPKKNKICTHVTAIQHRCAHPCRGQKMPYSGRYAPRTRVQFLHHCDPFCLSDCELPPISHFVPHPHIHTLCPKLLSLLPHPLTCHFCFMCICAASSHGSIRHFCDLAIFFASSVSPPQMCIFLLLVRSQVSANFYTILECCIRNRY